MRPRLLVWLLASGALLAGCERRAGPVGGDAAGPGAGPAGAFALSFQTDWYPQPEHGGFYQALARGYYRESGLEVTILPGGPRALVLQKLGMGQVPLALWRTDDVTVAVSRGLPLQLLAGIFQQSPQGLMFHAAHPLHGLRDLEHRVVMAGAASVWVPLVERRYGFELRLVPLTFSIAQFLEDPWLVQQCLITSEPYQARRAGVEVGTLLIDESGSDPYHAIVGNRDWVARHPREAAAFVRASLRGWRDFLEGDPSPAFAAISRLNPGHDEGSMIYARERMIQHRLVMGRGGDEVLGALDRARLQEQARMLHELHVAQREVSVGELLAPGFPPAP